MRFKEKVKGDDNRRRAYTYLTETKGLEPHVAAGILGNFMQESGQSLNIEAYNPNDMGKPSFGLAQWRGDRLNKLKKVAGKKANTLEGQLDFMMWEFSNTEKRAFKKLQESASVEEAALAFSTYYERPHKDYAHNDKRKNYAKNLYNTFVGTQQEYDYYEDPQQLYTEENTQENVAWESHTPPTREEVVDYSLDIASNPPQVPFVGYDSEEETEQVEQSQTPIVDRAVAAIEGRKNQMAALQQIIKANEVQYIDPNQPADPEPNSYGYPNGYPSMAEGGETDPKKEPRPLTEEEAEMQTYGVFGKVEKDTHLPDAVPHRRRGRERQPLNMKVQETTSVRRDTTNPLLTPIKEQEYDEFNNPQNMNYQDILNPTVVTHDRGKEQLKEKIESKSEFLNPLGMEKIDPTTIGNGESLQKLQAQLIDKGYDLGEAGADGVMGAKTREAIDRFNSKLSLNEELTIGDFKTPEQVKELQEFLISKGHNLNPDGRFKDDGVDGQLGSVTQKAIMDYNKKLGTDRLPYKGVKDGEGLLGRCAEEQCSEFVQNEIWRNLNPDLSRTEWNKKTGLTGNAWQIGDNIVKAGGRKVKPNGVAAGDVLTIYTGGNSEYQDQADKYGTGTTHTAVVDQVNSDGSYYILHNVHVGSKDSGFEGREWRELVKDGRVQSLRHGSFQVKGIYRPKADAEGKATKPLRKDVGLAIDPDKAQDLAGIGSFLGNAPEKIQTYIEPLNKFENKNKFSKIFELEEDEYQSLAQLTIGILGQESNFGTSPKAMVKEPVAEIASFLGVKKDEASEGAGQLKYDTNFHSDLTEFGINSRNFDKDKNVPIASMYKLATDYKRYLKKGYSKKDALYRAAVVYNASLQGESNGKSREEWAKSYDVDYANKAIQFASALGVQGEDKAYKTMIDDLLLEDNVYKWNNKVYTGRNE